MDIVCHGKCITQEKTKLTSINGSKFSPRRAFHQPKQGNLNATDKKVLQLYQKNVKMVFPLTGKQDECTGICNIPEDSMARFQSH
jgi:hypothetical protein